MNWNSFDPKNKLGPQLDEKIIIIRDDYEHPETGFVEETSIMVIKRVEVVFM